MTQLWNSVVQSGKPSDQTEETIGARASTTPPGGFPDTTTTSVSREPSAPEKEAGESTTGTPLTANTTDGSPDTLVNAISSVLSAATILRGYVDMGIHIPDDVAAGVLDELDKALEAFTA